MRHSGFTLYDSAYSEYYFTEKLWPEFDEIELDKALGTLKNAQRNFGK
jgi:undecaprenyl diphosphate synthase